MDSQALIKTGILCLASVVLEAVTASKLGKKWFESLNQPKFSFPFWIWYMVGGFYYIICATVAYRQFHSSDQTFTWPVGLLICMMLTNALSNVVLFKYRSLLGFYFVLYPFAILSAVLAAVLWNYDRLSAFLITSYLVWLGYDLYYFYALFRANR